MEAEARENYGMWVNRLKSYSKETDVVRSAWNMYKGNHWDNGKGYIGPKPINSDPQKDRVLSLISTAFTSRNVIAETTDRTIDGLISRSPGWTIYDQERMLTRAIRDAQRRLEIQKQTEMLNQDITSLANVGPDGTVPGVRPVPSGNKVTVNDGNIKVESQNEGNEQDDTETVNRKEIEAEIILSDLWTRLNLKQVIEEALSERLVARRGGARVYVPKKYADKEGKVKVSNLMEAVKAVRVENVKRSDLKVIDDEGDRISIVKLEKHKARTGQVLKGVEVSYVDDSSGLTFIKVYQPDQQDSDTPKGINNQNEDNMDTDEIIEDLTKSSGIFLDGNLFAEEMSGKPFVTEQMLQNNRALNLDLTLGVNILVEDGFTEMVTTNAAMSLVEIIDPSTGIKSKVPTSLKRGPSYGNNIVGIKTHDEKGMAQYEDPDVIFREPTSLSTFEAGENLYYKQCLAEAKQIFVLISGDSLASGESRIQARQDFLNLVRRYKPELDKFGTWLLSTLLHLVANISGQDGYFKGIGIVFDCKISGGDLSADEKNVVINRYEKGLISREDALVLLGTEDPLLEIDKIRADQAEKQYNEIRRLVITSRYSNQIQADKEVNGDPKDKEKKTEKKAEVTG